MRRTSTMAKFWQSVNQRRLVIIPILFILTSVSVLASARIEASKNPNPQPAGLETGKPAPLANGPQHSIYLPFVFQEAHRNYNVFGVDARMNANSGLLQLAETNTFWVSGIGINWSAVEPNKGDRNWGAISGVELQLLTAASYDFEPIVTVNITPTWAQDFAPYNKPCGRIKSNEFAAFASFISDVVLRYSKPPYNVKYWKIWNEPDVAPDLSNDPWLGCWGDDSDPYYGGGYYGDMLDVIYPAIKVANSEAQVIVGGLLLDCNPNAGSPPCDTKPALFLQGILENGSGNSFDGVGFHSYDYYNDALGRYGNSFWQSYWNSTGPVIIAKSNYLKGLLEDPTYGLSEKFLVILESAIRCNTVWGFDCGTNFEITKAYYLAQAYTVAIAQGLLGNTWYSLTGWPDNNTGLLDGSLNPLPAFHTYSFFTYELGGSTFVRVIPPSELQNQPVFGYEFDRGDFNIWVLWSKDGVSNTVTLPSLPFSIRETSTTGQVDVIPLSTSIDVTLAPIFIYWN